MMFRVTKSRFQRILEDIGGANIPFYKDGNQHCLETRLMLPLKTLAYGVAPHTFCDYFQMSRVYSRECTYQFDQEMKQVYLTR